MPTEDYRRSDVACLPNVKLALLLTTLTSYGRANMRDVILCQTGYVFVIYSTNKVDIS